ncbi:MAG TPA: PD-(D/E)XK nuclease family protein [Polyangiaceae bacterium]|nr:PD-(D/E)XK nuclease family protein [Polyangiaceae bacterium]
MDTARIATVERFAQRIPFTRPATATWDQVGSALHRFLAADSFDEGDNDRVDLARRILASEGLDAAFEAVHLVSASDSLRAFVERRWPDARWHREVAISAAIDTADGARMIQGVIDLLLETSSGVVVVDHKSFPGRFSEWPERALEYAPQLQVYALGLRTAGYTVQSSWIHFTVGGGAVEVANA